MAAALVHVHNRDPASSARGVHELPITTITAHATLVPESKLLPGTCAMAAARINVHKELFARRVSVGQNGIPDAEAIQGLVLFVLGAGEVTERGVPVHNMYETLGVGLALQARRQERFGAEERVVADTTLPKRSLCASQAKAILAVFGAIATTLSTIVTTDDHDHILPWESLIEG
jgi:hypothetical protein